MDAAQFSGPNKVKFKADNVAGSLPLVSASELAPFSRTPEFVLSTLNCIPFEQPLGKVTLSLRKGDITLMTAGS